ncbi:MAG: class I SAM-dependent methyltransferase [bacterium]|nr:class I SAM-dependent methyltransferase [Candidatus Sumerlaeota bacterium]
MQLYESRIRGLAELTRAIGDITTEIAARVNSSTGNPVRVLELGCGFGVVLLQLMRRFGDKVELHGVNYSAAGGDENMMRETARELKIFSDEEMEDSQMPCLRFFDACAAWPYPESYFDMIISQSSFIWFPDKIAALELINRVLKHDGVARIDMGIERGSLPPEYRTSILIWDRGRLIPFWEYIAHFPNLRMKRPDQSRPANWFIKLTRGKNTHPSKQAFLEMRHKDNFDMNLELVTRIDLREIHEKWGGFQSVYRLKNQITPRWPRDYATSVPFQS